MLCYLQTRAPGKVPISHPSCGLGLCEHSDFKSFCRDVDSSRHSSVTPASVLRDSS